MVKFSKVIISLYCDYCPIRFFNNLLMVTGIKDVILSLKSSFTKFGRKKSKKMSIKRENSIGSGQETI